MSVPELLQAMAPVLAPLEKLGAKHYVGGSVASSIHGVARTTLDAYLVAVLCEVHVPRLVSDLTPDFYVSESMIRPAIRNESSFNVIHLATMFKIDVFVAKGRPFDQSALERIRKDSLGDEEALEVFVATPEDVILNKLEWYRLGEEVSERQWNDALGVLKVQRGRLDRTYLEEWAGDLGISDLLRRAMTEAGIE